MSRALTAADRSALIRLASQMDKGSPERKAILAGLSRTSAPGEVNVPGKHILDNAKVTGYAKVSGNADVYGNARIGGTAVILGGEWDGSEGEILSGKWKAPGVPA